MQLFGGRIRMGMFVMLCIAELHVYKLNQI